MSVAVLGVAVVAWALWIPTGLDALWPWPPPTAGALTGRLTVVWANVLQPVTAYLTMIGIVVALFRCRWRDLAGSVLLALAMTVSIVTVLKSLVARMRPETPWLGGLHADASFPSGHAAAGTALAIAVVQVTWALTRRLRPTLVAAVISAVVAAAVCIGRLVLAVHHVSDVLGGALIACFSAALAAVLTGAWRVTVPTRRPRTIRVIWHPNRVRGRVGLERYLAREAARRGCPPPVWLVTEDDEHTVAQARVASEEGADLVLVLGGDGTIRQVLATLGLRASVGIVAAGSGNLLAKNLGIPLDAGRAMELALDGEGSPLDLLRVAVDADPERLAAVMVGAGADAAVVADTTERGKRVAGPFAYLAAGLRHVRATPTPARVTVDGSVIASDVSLVSVGNVGSLHPGVALLPAADPSDGRLDVLVASPRGSGDVFAMMVGVLLGRPGLRRVERLEGTRVAMSFGRPVPFQIDGDVIGSVTEVAVEVLPGAALLVRRSAT
ncbi:hypothetical protein BW730_15965 [Tessaracoccus aquimaris]|uniref:DAGKc domain-containing protein n=1 Tax=Tessaracoccus aquimaris TaxID=1332264 RepID=A0A1Q2CRN8_9ACTN|nr:bifunctional phosphatase PAP2/diacylglycerol kinase family protein [Tessaracoccus aquimaris]AQP48779.1 hypothetical protein BW730_15965 [Tessaracoccus aquimaris]